ncbi:MAG: hypothetical protein AAFR16_09180, partial [Pseudomonadota bacterium]
MPGDHAETGRDAAAAPRRRGPPESGASAFWRRGADGAARLIAAPEFPRGAAPFCDPSGWPGGGAGAGAEGAALTLIRPIRLDRGAPGAAPAILAQRVVWRRGEAQAVTLALPPARYAERAPGLVAEIEATLERLAAAWAGGAAEGGPPPAPPGPPARPAFDADDDAVAALLAAALETEGPPASATRAQARSSLAFWRGAARVLAAAPPALRPLLSAAALEPGSPTAGASSAWAAPVEATLRYDGGRADAGEPPPPDAAALERLSEAAPPAEAPEIEDAEQATALALDLIRDPPGGDAADPLERFLTEIDAEPPAPPTAPRAQIAHLRRLAGAAETGIAHRAALAPFGRARAAGLLAVADGDGFEAAWAALGARAPGRAAWRALLLRTPAWDLPAPIRDLRDWRRLGGFAEAIASGWPSGAPTPFDGPAFARRLGEFSARAAPAVAADPRALSGARADWLERLADALAAAEGPARAAAARALEDAAQAADVMQEPDLAAAARLARAGLDGGAGPPGPQDAPRRDPARLVREVFGPRRLRAAAAANAEGAAFWSAALEAGLAALDGP